MSSTSTTSISGKRKATLDRQARILGATTLDDDKKKQSLRDFAKKQLNHSPTDQEIEDYLDLPSTKRLLNIS